MVKVIERNNNPTDNFMNCNTHFHRATNNRFNTSKQQNDNSLFYSSKSDSSSDSLSENE